MVGIKICCRGCQLFLKTERGECLKFSLILGLTITLGIIVLLSAMSWIPYLLGKLICDHTTKCIGIDDTIRWMFGFLLEIICILGVTIFVGVCVGVCYGMYNCSKGIYVYIRGVFIGLDQSMQIAEKEAAFETSETIPLNSSSS